jgi:hypothetical protein
MLCEPGLRWGLFRLCQTVPLAAAGSLGTRATWCKRIAPQGSGSQLLFPITRGSACPCAGVAVKPTCINRAALAAVRRYLRPRTIHVVTATQPQCDVFESWAPNIRCHLQVATHHCKHPCGSQPSCWPPPTGSRVASAIMPRQPGGEFRGGCVQDAFLPGVTRRTVAEALERRFGASGGSTFRGRDLAGWYLQQARLPASSAPRALRGPCTHTYIAALAL